MRSLQDAFPQVVIPLEALDGSTLLRYNDQSVVLFPFVRGTHLHRERPKLREAAATLLAHLHTALLRQASNSAALERHLLIGAPPIPSASDPDILIDRELDRWHATLLQEPAVFTTGYIHGDYYRRNLLTRGARITALLDWDDLHRDALMQEVAWSTWELCKTATGDDWHLTRVREFIRSYQEAGGPCTPDEYATFIPFIRWRLREEARRHFAAVASGRTGEPEYVALLLRAFQRLQGCTVTFP
jgi:Ser/Thr protein kinase RdoA (MazF antagonist)